MSDLRILMKCILSALIVAAIFWPRLGLSEWLDFQGNPQPDTSFRKSKGNFDSWLVLTDDEAEALRQWNRPSPGVTFSSASQISRGEILTALILFRGCGGDNDDNCDVIVKFKIYQPDGALYADLHPMEVWIDKPAPPDGSLGLSVGYLRVLIEPREGRRVQVEDRGS